MIQCAKVINHKDNLRVFLCIFVQDGEKRLLHLCVSIIQQGRFFLFLTLAKGVFVRSRHNDCYVGT